MVGVTFQRLSTTRTFRAVVGGPRDRPPPVLLTQHYRSLRAQEATKMPVTSNDAYSGLTNVPPTFGPLMKKLRRFRIGIDGA